MGFNRESFDRGKAWFHESTICRNRFFRILLNPNDIHGAIEALQHCFELSCKSLYLMLDLPYPRDHDAAKNIEQVSEKLFLAIPGANQEEWPSLESWIKKNSKNLKKMHETSIYGDEEKGILASKLFSKDELGELTVTVSALWSFVYHTLFILGVENNLLTPEEVKEYEKFLESSLLAKKNESEKMKEYLKKIFEPKN